jgi:hypothetical protein
MFSVAGAVRRRQQSETLARRKRAKATRPFECGKRIADPNNDLKIAR